MAGFDWRTAGYIEHVDVKHPRHGRGVVSSIKGPSEGDKLVVRNSESVMEYGPDQAEELMLLGHNDVLYIVVVETGTSNIDPATLKPFVPSVRPPMQPMPVKT